MEPCKSSRFHHLRHSVISFTTLLCFSRVTLESWEEPGYEAKDIHDLYNKHSLILACIILVYVCDITHKIF